MAVYQEFMSRKYPMSDLPHWRCPGCGKTLFIEIDKLKKEKTGETKRKQTKSYWKDWHDVSFFQSYLSCSKMDCGETISISGVIFFEKKRNKSKEIVEFLKPISVFPPLQIFQIPEYCPDEVTDELQKAFSLFWSDYDSTAGKIRNAIELLLDDQGINIIYKLKKGSKRTKIPLHERIKLYEKKDPEIAKTLMAVKWIGNFGSHIDLDIELEHEDILKGFELFEHALIKIYSDHEANLLADRDKIVKNKKPLPYYSD